MCRRSGSEVGRSLDRMKRREPVISKFWAAQYWRYAITRACLSSVWSWWQTRRGLLDGGEGSLGRVPARTSCRMLSHGTIRRSIGLFGDVEVSMWAKMMSRSSWGMVRRVGAVALGVEKDFWARVDGVWAASSVVRSLLNAC
jgi:hypothetical protein